MSEMNAQPVNEKHKKAIETSAEEPLHSSRGNAADYGLTLLVNQFDIKGFKNSVLVGSYKLDLIEGKLHLEIKETIDGGGLRAVKSIIGRIEGGDELIISISAIGVFISTKVSVATLAQDQGDSGIAAWKVSLSGHFFGHDAKTGITNGN